MTDDALQDLKLRLEALEEERAVLSTLYRYGHAIDYGLEAEWLDLFTDDGAWDRRVVDQSHPSIRYEGKAALTTFISGHTRAPDRYHKHLLCEPVIRVEGDSASVASYWVRADTNAGGPFVFAFGRYLDRMVKRNGTWKFRERIVEIEGSPRL